MIIIQSGKLTIPENERFVGIAGDNTSGEKEFVIFHRAVPNSVYTLYLRFDNGVVHSVILPSEQINSDVVLTWDISSEDLKYPGIVTAQIKMTDGRGNITHTSRDYFLVGYSEEPGDDSGDYDPAEIERLEERIDAVEDRLPYVASGGVYITDEGGDIRIAQYSEVYSKSDIDGMIGNIESALAAV